MDRLTLPRAPWQDRAGLAKLCEALGASTGKTRFVGGAVRDTLLGIDVADVDLATAHSPDRVIALLHGNGIKAVPTGIAHGTITAVLPGGWPVEVTTLRRDISTDGRHATVAFTDDWREDAARRDFTINALYADPSGGALFDYFGGLEDLPVGRVRFIGDPLQRIAEDHLRILRFFRFHARFGDETDADALDACTLRANDLMALSRERIAGELLKLIVAAHAVRVVDLMIDHGIFAPVLPEIVAVDRLTALVLAEGAAGIAPHPLRRLAALLPPDADVAEAVGARLKLSKVDRKRLVSGASPVGGAQPYVLAYRLGVPLAIDRLLLAGHVDAARALCDWHPPTLPISGGALVERGINKGPDVAHLLKQVEDVWVAEGFPDTARVAALADEAVDQFRRASSSA